MMIAAEERQFVSGTEVIPPRQISTEPPVPTTNLGQDVWNAYVRCHRDATGYHVFQWRTVFETGLGHRCHYVAVQRGAKVTGVLPLVEVRSWMFGRALSSLPYVNYGGVLADSPEDARALLDHAVRLRGELGLSYVVLRHRDRQFPNLPVRSHKQSMLLPLGVSADEMWKALDRKVRNQIRKAEKSNLSVISGGQERLDEFYAVFARNMRDLGSPVYGKALFASMLQTFPDDVRVHLVRLGSTTIAGAISYRYGDVVEVPSASSLREHRALCPNHLLYWELIRKTIEQGGKTFDFGRSTPGDGTWNFKEQWGAVAAPLHWEYALSEGEQVPAADRQAAGFQRKVEMWKRLPVSVATLIGPRIARAVP
jgi:FemAB-related protein (PEP-CTERM system-associated)